MKIIVTAFLSILCLTSFACLNENHVTKSGRQTMDLFSLKDIVLYKLFDETAIKNLLAEKPSNEEEILSTQNSIAVNLIKLRRLDEAEKILDVLYRNHPEDYSVTVNLGTLYELQGKNKKALEYIKKAIALNSNSHNGSEWFHIKVLEFKLKNIPTNQISSQNILGISSLKNKDANEIGYNINYQLRESIPFTPTPNIMMAKILQEYGDFLADSISIKGAYVIYEIAMDYDKDNVLNLAKKRDDLKPYFKKYKETLPLTNNYYADHIINEIDNNKIEIATSLLDKGLNYFKEKEEERKRKALFKNILIASGIGICAIFAFLFLMRRRKSDS
jgi:tetratricopeptide (TPR) repeat protein